MSFEKKKLPSSSASFRKILLQKNFKKAVITHINTAGFISKLRTHLQNNPELVTEEAIINIESYLTDKWVFVFHL